MTIHPSLIEKVSLDAREHNADVAADIKRSFAYVGPVTVTSHEEAADAPARNDLRLVCRMGRPYWTDEGDGAEMWDVMRSWLEGKAYKVASTMANFNTSRAEHGHQTVHYDRVELDMKPYALGIALTQDDCLPAVDELAARFRELLLAGVIPADARGVEMPGAASLAEQRAAAEAQAKAAAAAAAEGQVPAEGEAAASAEEGAQEEVASPLDEALAAAGVASAEPAGAPEPASAPAAGEEPADAAAPAEGEEPADPTARTPEEAAKPAKPAVAHVSDNLASVDTRVWDVLLADGSTRQLDSASGEWL